MTILSLAVSGMACGGCEANVQDKVSALAGVESVTATHGDNQVVVEFDEAKITVDLIKQTINDAGYEVQ